MSKDVLILIAGDDPAIVKISEMSLLSEDFNVIVCGNIGGLPEDISHENPDIVLIWNIGNADKFISIIRETENLQCKPFFIITTSYRRIYDELCTASLPNIAAVLEPADMNVIKDIIKNVFEYDADECVSM